MKTAQQVKTRKTQNTADAPERFFEPAQNAAAEITVKKSRFIAEIFCASSAKAARVLIKAQKARYADASHGVHAFAAGNKGETRGMSDDGEPPGTAARPIMNALTGARYTNILLTVTRYFGGTLLGTGGLSRAYAEAAKAVCAVCEFLPAARKFHLTVYAPVECSGKCKKILQSAGALNLENSFGGGEAALSCLFAFENADADKNHASLAAALQDAANGRARIVIGERN
jgi:uncharacterized YigZ family protein